MIFFVSFWIITLSPVLFLIAILIRVKLDHNTFQHSRPGKDGKLFNMIKFRTMKNEFDQSGRMLPDELRMTRLGSILRKSSLDELPELINVLKGDMSIVGPRPLLIEYLPLYQANKPEGMKLDLELLAGLKLMEEML